MKSVEKIYIPAAFGATLNRCEVKQRLLVNVPQNNSFAASDEEKVVADRMR